MVLKLATGEFKGMTLASTDTARELRPTQAMVREAIINTLSSIFMAEDLEFSGLQILDLFSGSGSMGFEFLSNGAQSICFVERDPKCQKLLRSNAKKMRAESKVKVCSGILPKILKSGNFSQESFNLVFFDPPFKFTVDQFLANVKAVLDNKLLQDNAFLVLEYKNDELAKALEEQFSEHLVLLKTKKYGGCTVVFARKIFSK
ncbi:MAG: RsmD family RNA methyltransferase [Candidatus Melainabacteria bacterium]|nr:RsmD family RNA methyltransferase [Candidatus Melainabacteria bacterium]